MKTALVLSAGGMFGAYQAGAWKTLSAVFQPDLVAGSSAGAINGWAIAGGCSADELIDNWMRPRTAGMMRVRFPLLPWHGIFDPSALEQMAQEMFRVYTPRIPFGATIVELPRLRLELVRETEMTWRHLVAACAIPFGFPPVWLHSRPHVDGGLLSILPVWAAAEMGAGRAIAINVMAVPPSSALKPLVTAIRRLAPKHGVAREIEVVTLTPSARLGRLRDALHWRADNVRRWVEMGRRDAEALLEKRTFIQLK